MSPKLSKDIEGIKNGTEIKFSENERSMSEMQNSLGGINRQLDIAREKKISECGDSHKNHLK